MQLIIGLVIGVAMGMFFLGLLQASKINNLYIEIEHWKAIAQWKQEMGWLNGSWFKQNYLGKPGEINTATKNNNQSKKEG